VGTQGVTTSAGTTNRSGVVGRPWADETIVKVPVPLSVSVEQVVMLLEPVPSHLARR
jgi:hypothetical protein